MTDIDNSKCSLELHDVELIQITSNGTIRFAIYGSNMGLSETGFYGDQVLSITRDGPHKLTARVMEPDEEIEKLRAVYEAGKSWLAAVGVGRIKHTVALEKAIAAIEDDTIHHPDCGGTDCDELCSDSPTEK